MPRRLRVRFRGFTTTGAVGAFSLAGQSAALGVQGGVINASFTLAASNLDATTLAAYNAAITTAERAAIVVAALTGTVVCEIVDAVGVVRASGTMASPWATASGATITVGEVAGQGIDVTSGGAPDGDWYCQFRSGTRFVRGTFGVLGSGRDFVWSLVSFQTGSRGTLGTVSVTATGTVPTAGFSMTLTPSQGARSGTPITVSTWTEIASVTNFAGTWTQYGGTIPGADEGVVVYIWAGPSNWRAFQLVGKATPVLTHFSNGSNFYTDATKTTLRSGAAPDVQAMRWRFDVSVTESGAPLAWIKGAHTTTDSTLVDVEVTATSPVFGFNSVPAVNMARVVQAVKEWRLPGVYIGADYATSNAAAPSVVWTDITQYNPETAAPNPSPNPFAVRTYQGLTLDGSGGDATSGRSFYEAREAALLDESIRGVTTNNTVENHWRMMSQALNVARVPLLCVWDDTTHRVMDPQKGSRPWGWHPSPQEFTVYGMNDVYLLDSTGTSVYMVKTHPWTGTSYLYEATGCPIFHIVQSGLLAWQMATQYAHFYRPIYPSKYIPPALSGDVDRAESWGYGRLSKLIGQVPTTGRVPGGFSYAELSEMASEWPLVPTYGITPRMTRRKAQTTAGTTIDNTKLFACQLFNLPHTAVPDAETYGALGGNQPVPGNDNVEGLWTSILMLNYALENSVALALAANSTAFKDYIGEILTCLERLPDGVGAVGYLSTNLQLGPEVVDANKGAAWTYTTRAAFGTYINGRGKFVNTISNGSTFNWDPRLALTLKRSLRWVKVAADRGRLPAGYEARADAIMSSITTGLVGYTTLTSSYSYGNYFGVPPSIESEMST
jgi:hypothetical protein